MRVTVVGHVPHMDMIAVRVVLEVQAAVREGRRIGDTTSVATVRDVVRCDDVATKGGEVTDVSWRFRRRRKRVRVRQRDAVDVVDEIVVREVRARRRPRQVHA